MHAITDDQPRTRLCRTPEESRHVLRLVLPIAVHGQGPLELALERGGEAGLERCAFARSSVRATVPSAGPDSVAVVDQVRAVDKSRFVRTSGDLSTEDLAAVESALRRVLALPD